MYMLLCKIATAVSLSPIAKLSVNALGKSFAAGSGGSGKEVWGSSLFFFLQFNPHLKSYVLYTIKIIIRAY